MPVWMLWSREKNLLAPAGIQTPDVQPVAYLRIYRCEISQAIWAAPRTVRRALMIMCEHTYDFSFSTEVFPSGQVRHRNPFCVFQFMTLRKKETTLLYSQSRKELRRRGKPDLLESPADEEEQPNQELDGMSLAYISVNKRARGV
jgi:hypothetical protein